MKEFTYLIVGNGMTADAAARGIRERDAGGTIGIIGSEPREPYFRPPLTKSLWQGTDEGSIWCGTSELSGVEILHGREIVEVDPDRKNAKDDRDEAYTWQKLLLATGGAPRELPNTSDKGILYYRNLDDYHTLRRKVQQEGTRVLVIGGGFIGSEIAAALTMNGVQVTMVFPESGICGRIFPNELSDYLNQYFEEQGVKVLSGTTVEELNTFEEVYELRTTTGANIEAHVVVAGLGINPSTRLAEELGLEVDDGVQVDKYLRTSHSEVYAAGDVANFYNSDLNRRLRVEHDDNTQVMGRTAGYNMAGGQREYEYLPLFYADLFDLGYEAVGVTGSGMDVVTHWEQFAQKGIIFYLQDERVQGIIFWNVWDMVDKGRELIAEGNRHDEQTLGTWYKENITQA